MEQQIRFCNSADGTQIAYADLGEGPPLVCVFSWPTNLEMDWGRAESRAWLERIASRRRLVRFDRRGVGASERQPGDFSMEAQIADVSAVADHLGLERFSLWGFADGAAVSVAYAAEHPERLIRLVLWAAYPRGEDVMAAGAGQSLVAFARKEWSMARRVIATTIFPAGPAEGQRWVSYLMRESMTAEVAAKYLEFQMGVDLGPLLGRVRTPTLVLHRRDERVVPISGGRSVAALIPDARFVALEGDIAYVFYGETAHVDIAEEFLDEGSEPEPAPAPSPALRTVLFTDLEGHTEMMSRLGDERGRGVLREHERITREVLKAHEGTEVKTMGDGFMASFGSVTKAVECAVALQRAVEARNKELGTGNTGEELSVRCGLNAGEPIEEEGDLFGATVILASRIAAKAEGGEILVADTVRGLCSGKGFLFADRGEFVAKGFEEPVRVYEVRWRE
jgi:class 3 adenylate cyclase/pimeloyl-ACP methyl ester carboxylesterase